MISKEDFEKLIDGLRDKLDDTTFALVSEELLATKSAYNNGFDEYQKAIDDMEKLKSEKDELLKVNGKLYQKIGFDKDDVIEKKEDNPDDDKNEKIKIEDVINEKGELI